MISISRKVNTYHAGRPSERRHLTRSLTDVNNKNKVAKGFFPITSSRSTTYKRDAIEETHFFH